MGGFVIGVLKEEDSRYLRMASWESSILFPFVCFRYSRQWGCSFGAYCSSNCSSKGFLDEIFGYMRLMVITTRDIAFVSLT